MSDHCNGAKDKLVTLGARRRPEPPEYWKSPEELRDGVVHKGEFPGGLPSLTSLVAPAAPAHDHGDHDHGDHDHGDHDHGGHDDGEPDNDHTRRDFLTILGFGATAATLAACRAPEQRAIPLPVASDAMIAGVANYYATTCGGCASACSLLVKQRDGRPIKIEGNEASPINGGATCAAGQATVLSLYDNERLRGPVLAGKLTEWDALDAHVAAQLADAAAKQAKVVLLSSTINSPSLHDIIGRWTKKLSGFRHVMYDAVSTSALRTACRQVFGRAIVPHYAFDRARVIVSLDADFLGTWLSPVEFTRQYTRGRALDRLPSLHIQFEPGMSVTGSNADQRVPVAPSAIGPIALALLSRIARSARENAQGLGQPVESIDAAILDAVAAELWKHRGESLVVSGSNDVATQLVVLAMNRMLGNVGKTLDVERPSLQAQGDDAAMAELVEQMQRGEIHTLILHGVNPVYDYADAAGFTKALGKVAFAVSTADRIDETSTRVHAIAPDHHFLESWGDAEPIAGHLSLFQPTIAPLFHTRAAAESLLRWLDEPSDHYAFVREFWRSSILPRQQEHRDFDAFWDHTLERGVLDIGGAVAVDATATPVPADVDDDRDWRAAATTIREDSQKSPAGKDDRYELALFESVGLRDGRDANNPWLLEMPDPISKVTWGNVAMVAPKLADQLGLRAGDVVSLTAAAGTIELPVFLQPGQHARTISVALGFGRQQVGKAGNSVGANAFPYTNLVRGARRRWADGVAVAGTGRREQIAGTQSHFNMEGRPIALEMARADLDHTAHEGEHEEHPNLWNERPQGEKSWGMTIDLDSCTGCSACVVACQAENNIAVIGKDQVQRQRIMHWMRIDRYYHGAEDNPQSIHQPMMCQHCGHAPCETVCPVLATTTSSEGLNQQVYNRCIGTRYCANNCPYKVRRFNWYNYTGNPRFDYNMANPVGRLVLNPDVTVRSRGVMEKCSLCVQRIHAAKNTAVKRGSPVKDGEIKTACQQVCPSDAIVFGDLNDPKSKVAEQMRSPRTYRVLDELGTRPNVAYLKKVRHGQST